MKYLLEFCLTKKKRVRNKEEEIWKEKMVYKPRL